MGTNARPPPTIPPNSMLPILLAKTISLGGNHCLINNGRAGSLAIKVMPKTNLEKRSVKNEREEP